VREVLAVKMCLNTYANWRCLGESHRVILA
jgi:hypothetical protein